MPTPTPRTINDYANAMFRHERLNDDWLCDCAAYLKAVFGDALTGRTVIDYAFGRGNWSLAFLRAGAARVIAIDAAEDNVARLSQYCREHGIENLDIVHGNVLDGAVGARGDIVWLYGILHHIEAADEFMARIAALAPAADALFYVYAYDRHSPRQFVVETCRALVRYDSEAAFRRDALCLSRPARLRARDDLTAPHIDWYDARGLTEMLARSGLRPIARLGGFEAHTTGVAPEEFVPHQWLCRRGNRAAIEVLDPPRRHTGDIRVLQAMADRVARLRLDDETRRRIGLGLFNAHFSALGSPGGADAAVLEDFLYLLYVLFGEGADADGAAAPYVDLALAALEGRERGGMVAAAEMTVLSEHLRDRNIRI